MNAATQMCVDLVRTSFSDILCSAHMAHDTCEDHDVGTGEYSENIEHE